PPGRQGRRRGPPGTRQCRRRRRRADVAPTRGLLPRGQRRPHCPGVRPEGQSGGGGRPAVCLGSQANKRASDVARKRANTQTGWRATMKKRTPLSFNVEKVIPSPAMPADETGLQATAQTRKGASEQTKPGREGRQFIAAHVPPEAAKQFRLLAVQQEKTTQDL